MVALLTAGLAGCNPDPAATPPLVGLPTLISLQVQTGQAGQATFTVENSQPTQLVLNLTADASWLAPTTPWTVEARTTTEVPFTFTCPMPGTFKAALTITASGAPQGRIPVELTCAAAPTTRTYTTVIHAPTAEYYNDGRLQGFLQFADLNTGRVIETAITILLPETRIEIPDLPDGTYRQTIVLTSGNYTVSSPEPRVIEVNADATSNETWLVDDATRLRITGVLNSRLVEPFDEAGTVVLRTPYGDSPPIPLAADGSFSGPLDPPALYPITDLILWSDSCPTSRTVTDPAARISARSLNDATFFLARTPSGKQATLEWRAFPQPPAGEYRRDVGITLIYADRPVRLQATADCGGPLNVDWDLNRGWNFVLAYSYGRYPTKSFYMTVPSSSPFKVVQRAF